ncbi:MAG: SPOR domain-containing protein [Paracoccaceae bacterium]
MREFQVGVLVFGFLALAGAAQATLVHDATGPAELPPASFTGPQFVDSRGCAYIRTGYGGAVTWIPRARRNRQVMCGLKPTFGRTARTSQGTTAKTRTVATIPVPTASANPKPARVPGVKTRAMRKPVSGAPAPTIFTTRKPPVATAPPKTVRAVRTGATAPRRQVSGAPAPTVFTAYEPPSPKVRTQRQAAFVTAPLSAPGPVSGAPAPTVFRNDVRTAAPRVRHARRVARRTGPQPMHPADELRLWRAQHGTEVAHLAAPVVPNGYKSLLSEDALATRRGVGTPQGQAAMDLLWTQTMPRRLIDVTTGRDMTAELPQIAYPYTNVFKTTSNAIPAGYGTAPIGKRIRHKVRPQDEASPVNMSSLKEVAAIKDVSALATDVATRRDRDGARPTATLPHPASHRFVQVATFGVAANATRTLARFGENGLPTSKRPISRKGRKLEIVLLGPFQDQRLLNEALAQARDAGFADAFLVN